jgi:PAS domain S-box-containing protein
MTESPSFDDIFAVMSAASIGELDARVEVPAHAEVSDIETRFAIALNVLLDDLGGRAATAGRELQERERLAHRLRILGEAGREFSAATGELDSLLDIVARRLGETLGDACSVRLVPCGAEWREPEGAAFHRDPALLEATREVMNLGRQRFGEGISGRVAATGKAVLLAQVTTADVVASTDPRYRAYLERLGVTSLMALPLSCRGKVVGVAVLLRSRPDHPYDEDDHRFAQSIADDAALAIGNTYSLAAERSAREAADEALKALTDARARFARLAETGLIGVVVHDVGARPPRVVEMNDAVLTMLGRSREELTATSFAWSDLTPPEWKPEELESLDRLAKSRVLGLREKEYFHKDGRRVPVLTGSAMLDGQSSLCISFMLDLTERNAAQSALERANRERAANAKFRALLEAAPDAIVIARADGVITLVNRQTEALFGYDRAELVEQPVEVLIPERFREAHSAHRAKYMGVARVRAMGAGLDLYGRHRNGREFPVEISLSPLETDDGLLVSAAIRDVTARKQVEAALAEAKEAAEAASRELEAFSYSVAHDLRAPLRGMNGFAQILLDTYSAKIDDDGRDWLNEIVQNAAKMANLIDGLLALSRVTRSELRVHRVDLSTLMSDTVRRLRETESERAVEFRVMPNLHADVDPRLAQALVDNLLGNAWKFTSKTPSALVEFGATEREGARAFYVKDNGAGFDMAFANKLFAPFQRLHTGAEFPGTGIGLATVQRIVRRHGGKVWAEGQVGHGATFFFTLTPGTRAYPPA